jgi:hypothetical protein
MIRKGVISTETKMIKMYKEGRKTIKQQRKKAKEEQSNKMNMNKRSLSPLVEM